MLRCNIVSTEDIHVQGVFVGEDVLIQSIEEGVEHGQGIHVHMLRYLGPGQGQGRDGGQRGQHEIDCHSREIGAEYQPDRGQAVDERYHQ